jgi:excisionase family DNA binding protein
MKYNKNEQMHLMSPSEAAKLLGIGTERVRQLERDGRLSAAAKTGQGWRLFKRSDVEKLAAERKSKHQKSRQLSNSADGVKETVRLA